MLHAPTAARPLARGRWRRRPWPGLRTLAALSGAALAILGLGITLVALLPYAAPAGAVAVPSDAEAQARPSGVASPFGAVPDCSPARRLFRPGAEADGCRAGNDRRLVVVAGGLAALVGGAAVWALGNAGSRAARVARG